MIPLFIGRVGMQEVLLIACTAVFRRQDNSRTDTTHPDFADFTRNLPIFAVN